jgi:hypothetical protein
MTKSGDCTQNRGQEPLGSLSRYLTKRGGVPDRCQGPPATYRSLSLRGRRENHAIYFCELSRVTVRVNRRAMQGYVRP